MSIQDAKAAKAKLESEISSLMAEFTKNTGLSISDIDIEERYKLNSGERNYTVRVRAEL